METVFSIALGPPSYSCSFNETVAVSYCALSMTEIFFLQQAGSIDIIFLILEALQWS